MTLKPVKFHGKNMHFILLESMASYTLLSRLLIVQVIFRDVIKFTKPFSPRVTHKNPQSFVEKSFCNKHIYLFLV